MDSILISVKKTLGIHEDYEHFDLDVIIHINTVLLILNQIGVGPTEGFVIKDSSSKWSEFIQNDTTLEMVKSYVYMKVKLLFDPSSSSTLIKSTNNLLSELEWRIQSSVECK